MPDFDSLFAGLKNDITTLAKDSLGEFARQAATDATDYLETVKADLQKYTTQLATGQIDKDMFAYLLNAEQSLGKMKIQTQVGMAKIKADAFTAGVKNMVIDTLGKVAGNFTLPGLL